MKRLFLVANIIRKKLTTSSDRRPILPEEPAPRAVGPRPAPLETTPQSEWESEEQFNWESTRLPPQSEDSRDPSPPDPDERITRRFHRHTLPSPESAETQETPQEQIKRLDGLVMTSVQTAGELERIISNTLGKILKIKTLSPADKLIRNQLTSGLHEAVFSLLEYLTVAEDSGYKYEPPKETEKDLSH
jgi:hypothetical protein